MELICRGIPPEFGRYLQDASTVWTAGTPSSTRGSLPLRRFTAGFLSLVLLVMVATGCTGRKADAPLPGQPPSAPVTGKEEAPPARSPEPALRPAVGVGQGKEPLDLTERLVTLPRPQAQPAYRWTLPPAGHQYLPLPAGLLVVWTQIVPRPDHGGQFSISVRNPDGKTPWSRQWPKPAREIRDVDVTVSGDRLAVVERDGSIHVLSLRDGQPFTAIRAELKDDSDRVRFTANGGHVAVQRRTGSGSIRYSVSLYPLGGEPRVLDGAEGYTVLVSPFNDLALGLTPKGVEVKTAGKEIGVIPYTSRGGGAWVLESSADGELIWLAANALSG